MVARESWTDSPTGDIHVGSNHDLYIYRGSLCALKAQFRVSTISRRRGTANKSDGASGSLDQKRERKNRLPAPTSSSDFGTSFTGAPLALGN